MLPTAVSRNGIWNGSESLDIVFWWDCLEECPHFVAYGLWCFLFLWGSLEKYAHSRFARGSEIFGIFVLGLSRGICSFHGRWALVIWCFGLSREIASGITLNFLIFGDCLEEYTRHFLVHKQHVTACHYHKLHPAVNVFS